MFRPWGFSLPSTWNVKPSRTSTQKMRSRLRYLKHTPDDLTLARRQPDTRSINPNYAAEIPEHEPASACTLNHLLGFSCMVWVHCMCVSGSLHSRVELSGLCFEHWLRAMGLAVHVPGKLGKVFGCSKGLLKFLKKKISLLIIIIKGKSSTKTTGSGSVLFNEPSNTSQCEKHSTACCRYFREHRLPPASMIRISLFH